jgi:glutamate dehydrogenase/leucine dehydrogenase
MDSFNKVISFVLGLVVVLVFLAVITGKINLKGKSSSTTSSSSFGLFNFGRTTPTATLTPTQKPATLTVSGSGTNNLYKQNNQAVNTSAAKSIPSTGLPTLFIPALLSGLMGGSFLRKAGKK